MARRGDGIYLRKNTWWLDAVIHGRRYQISLGKNIKRSDAAEIAMVKRAGILKGELGIGRKKADISFGDAAGIFLDWAKMHKSVRTHSDYEACISKLRNYFGGKMLSEIDPFLVEEYKARRVGEGARVRPNRELAVLRNLYNKMIRFNKYEGENPVRGFEPVRESRGKDRILTPEEEMALLQNASEPLRSLIIVDLQTGLRVYREALTLMWTNVDLAGRTLIVEAAFSKTHEMREIALNSIAIETLKVLKETTPGPWVFMTRAKSKTGPWRRLKSIKSAFERACRRANLSGVTPHSLRHTWASRMEMSGASQKTMMELGGWKDPKMVARYSHTSKQHRLEAVEKIAGYSPTDFIPPKVSEPFVYYAPVAQFG